MNSQQHHETVRCIFDFIDYGFEEYQNLTRMMPLISNLVDNTKYYDTWGKENQVAENLHLATRLFAVNLFMLCGQAGIFMDQKTPYMLETVQDDAILLNNSMARDILLTS